MPDQGCRAMDVHRGSSHSGRKVDTGSHVVNRSVGTFASSFRHTFQTREVCTRSVDTRTQQTFTNDQPGDRLKMWLQRV